GIPLKGTEIAPIRFVPVGLPESARELAGRLMADGLYTNVATFPAVPMKQAGVRFTLTLHHQHQDIVRLVEALAHHCPGVSGDKKRVRVPISVRGADNGASAPTKAIRSPLQLEH